MTVCNQNHLTAMGSHMPYGITQCYLPLDFFTLTVAEAGTRFSDTDLTWVVVISDDSLPAKYSQK